MSTTTNGSATDDSNGSSSNKRSRNDDGGLARRRIGDHPPQEVSIKRKSKRNPAPYDSGIATAETYVASLHTGTHNVLSECARIVLGAYATYYRAFTKFEREKNNKTFIPNACRFKLELQPMAAVAKSDGFKSLMRESAEVVEQCQLALKTEWLKTQWLNVIEHRNVLTINLLKSLYGVTSMLCAQEHSLFATWTEHHIVAEFINEHHVKMMMFCDIVVNEENKTTLQKRYCELHNLDVSQHHSTPLHRHRRRLQQTKMV